VEEHDLRIAHFLSVFYHLIRQSLYAEIFSFFQYSLCPWHQVHILSCSCHIHYYKEL
jgi:hypothetical protein